MGYVSLKLLPKRPGIIISISISVAPPFPFPPLPPPSIIVWIMYFQCWNMFTFSNSWNATILLWSCGLLLPSAPLAFISWHAAEMASRNATPFLPLDCWRSTFVYNVDDESQSLILLLLASFVDDESSSFFLLPAFVSSVDRLSSSLSSGIGEPSTSRSFIPYFAASWHASNANWNRISFILV